MMVRVKVFVLRLLPPMVPIVVSVLLLRPLFSKILSSACCGELEDALVVGVVNVLGRSISLLLPPIIPIPILPMFI